MRTASLALVPLLVLGCGKESLAPAIGPMPRFQATSTMTRGSFFQDVTVFIPCLAQDVRFHGEVPFAEHQITSASGQTLFKIQLVPVTPVTPQFFADALASGTTYIYKNGHPINQEFIVGPGQVFTNIDREVYQADDGDQLSLTLQSHLTVNANGDVTVDRTEFSDFQCSSK
jgi:hypothetical protein